MATCRVSAFVLLLVGIIGASSPQAQAQVYRIEVEALIDTTDQLRIQGSTLQWYHPGAGAAVGRHAGANAPTIISTSLDGMPRMDSVSWTPAWPLNPPNEIRFEASSSTFTDLLPALPAIEPLLVTTSVVSGRGSLSVLQTPTAANAHTLIVQYTDGVNGSANLKGAITIVIPEPGALSSAGIVAYLSVRRRRRGIRQLNSASSPDTRPSGSRCEG